MLTKLREGREERRGGEKEREKGVGILCVKIDNDLAVEAWTQRESAFELHRMCINLL